MSNIPQEQTKPYMMDRMAETRRELESFVGSLTDEQLTRPGKDGGWSVKDHLAHLAMWEAGVAALLRREPRWEAMGLTRDFVSRSSEEEINAAIERRHKALSLAEVRQLFADSHQAMLDTLESLTTEDLHRPVNFYEPGKNDRPVGGLVIGNTTDHYAEHLPWIRAIVDRQS